MENKEVLSLAKHFYNNYPDARRFAFWKLLSLMDRHRDKLICVKEDGKILGSALYLRLNDEDIKNIIYGEISIGNPEIAQDLLSRKGDNIHFIYVFADGEKTILKGLKKVIKKENPRSVSWYKPNMELRFIKFRRILCHQSQ